VLNHPVFSERSDRVSTVLSEAPATGLKPLSTRRVPHFLGSVNSSLLSARTDNGRGDRPIYHGSVAQRAVLIVASAIGLVASS